MENLSTKVVSAFVLLSLTFQSASPLALQVAAPEASSASRPSIMSPGQSVTLLSDGRWLLLGGLGKNGPSSAAVIRNSATNSVGVLKIGMNFPRAWHTATLLPDGTVLILGGIGTDAHTVPPAEIFDPVSLVFRSATLTLTPRAHHVAALLTDGHVLVTGGADANGNPLNTTESWDFRSQSATTLDVQLPIFRLDDHETVLPDGDVLLWGGSDPQGNPLNYAELYDSALNRFLATTPIQEPSVDLNLPMLEASIPEDGATKVAVNTMIAVRFSKLLLPQSVTSRSAILQGPSGLVVTRVVAAESGRLGFVTPKSSLLPGTKYTLTLQSAIDSQGLALVEKTVSFTTAATDNNADNSSDAANGPSSSDPNLPSLLAPPGVTAVAGRTLRLDDSPLPNVTFTIDNQSVRSDTTGRFLLAHVAAGHHALAIDGRTAGDGNHAYGVFEVGVDLQDGQTTVLPYKVWMTALDTAHAVKVQFPTTAEVVTTSPLLPGLEFHIPPKTVITDIDGRVATEISITPIPIKKPPFPLPWVQVPIYFTIQPGGGYIKVNDSSGPKGARLVYPNTFHQAPGSRMNFWNYDPDTTRGWFVYGQGSVSANGDSVAPDPGVVLYGLTGAMVAGSGSGAQTGPGPGGCSISDCQGNSFWEQTTDGEPVDLASGLFIYKKTDLYLPDVIPISLTRVYRQGDNVSRPFGIGTTHPYDMFIIGNLNDLSYVELVLPDGERIRFDRTAGSFWDSSFLQCVTAPGPFYGAKFQSSDPGFSFNGLFWLITLRDGTVLKFLQPGNSGTQNYQGVGVVSITDRNGNTLNISRDPSTNQVTSVTSPNGRWIQFTYDTNNPPRITQAQDNTGRTVKYSYDAKGHLFQVIDANSGTWTYGWDPTHLDQMTSITDPKTIKYLQNS
jgi:YD repeat-containing protein